MNYEVLNYWLAGVVLAAMIFTAPRVMGAAYAKGRTLSVGFGYLVMLFGVLAMWGVFS